MKADSTPLSGRTSTPLSAQFPVAERDALSGVEMESKPLHPPLKYKKYCKDILLHFVVLEN